MFNENQISFSVGDEKTIQKDLILKNIVIDRGSKYTLVAKKVTSKKEVYEFTKNLLKDDYFRKATHNSYAYRIKLDNGSILESKNDDGEFGAGMCILRELQRENGTNMIIIVTRYFGGIKLENDRFKNVIDACKIFFKHLN